MRKIYLLLCIVSFSAFAQSDGPNEPKALTYTPWGCLSCPGADWIDLNEAASVDGKTANVTLGSGPTCSSLSTCYYSKALVAKSFGFAIPSGSDITGYELIIERFADSLNAIADSSVKLFYNNSFIGDNKAPKNGTWDNQLNAAVYGTSLDDWGTKLTPDMINNDDSMGVFIKVHNESKDLATAFIDGITLTVHYTTPTGIKASSTRNGKIQVAYVALNETIHLNHSGETSIVTIYNSLGQIVYSNNSLSKGLTQISTASLEKGVYFIRTKVNDKENTSKIVVY